MSKTSSALQESRNSSRSESGFCPSEYLEHYAFIDNPSKADPIQLKFYISEDELWFLSQALLDDDSEQDETKKIHFRKAYQKVLQDLQPRCTITTDGGKLVFVTSFQRS